MVRKADLGRLEEIGAGAFGRVFRTAGFQLPGDPTELAYKEFTTEHAEQAARAQTAVSLWDTMSASDRDLLGRHAAWPRALVHDGRSVCGLLMPLLTDDYFLRLTAPITGTRERQPRAMSWLIATDAQRRKAGVDIPAIDRVDRLVLLAKLVYVVGLLHRLGWVYGDLSFNNVAFALSPPRIMLLDCDGAASLTDPARLQAHTPFWEPPEHQTDQTGTLRQDRASDVYKLGLAVLRCLTPGKGAASSRDPRRLAGALDPEGTDLVTRMLSAVPGARPEARDGFAYLERALAGRVTPPVVRDAVLTTPIRLRGQDARIAYQVDGATHLELEAANARRIQMPVTTGPASYAFRPDASGPVSLIARNRFGETRVLLGDVELYELPRVDLGALRLPQVDLPSLPAVSVADANDAAATRPPVTVGTSAQVPPPLEIAELIASAVPPKLPVSPGPPVLPDMAEAIGPLVGIVVREAASVTSQVLDALQGAPLDLRPTEPGAPTCTTRTPPSPSG